MNKTIVAVIALAALAAAGCTSQKGAGVPKGAAKAVGKEDGHGHETHAAGPHGGVMFDLGRFHGEFTIDRGKQEATIYVFAMDEETPQPIGATQLDLAVKSPNFTIVLKPAPQEGDPSGKSSRFAGNHAELANIKDFEGAIVALIDGKPSEGQFKFEAGKNKLAKHANMPEAISGTPAERELFLVPGGIYTAADIKANGDILPSKKYAGISWPHDDDLKPGDKLCPVTTNKADPRCQWIVNGKTYEFCCTPCLDKFVKWAKKQPEKIKDPEAYIQK